MGRFGGRELGYGSDADVLFVHEPAARAPTSSEAAERRHRPSPHETAPAAPDPPPPTRRCSIDADLRPGGQAGPLVRSLESYAAYYRRWSLVWE